MTPLRIIFSIISAIAGFWLTLTNLDAGDLILPYSVGMGIFCALITFFFVYYSERLFANLSAKALVGATIGVAGSLLLFLTFAYFSQIVGLHDKYPIFTYPIVFLSILCLGIAVGLKKGADPEPEKRTPENYFFAKVLDTSAIIDGRISDISEIGFIEGEIIVPQFVIRELQWIADSPDSLKKVRGRRGLEVLKKMQDQKNVKVKIVDRDFTSIKEVDLKLVRLAKELKGHLVTNDFNLTKVANLQGVRVLNVNQLANSLRPVILPGEHMKIKVIKQGKDENQGVGYLDDGTMVVIDNAKKHISQEINIIITSVIQTPTGRMIFSKLGDIRDKDSAISNN
tara:strand:+ start:566 stop:1585 length:1020 start_codon:yes stop_codon:yes gene_type:complete